MNTLVLKKKNLAPAEIESKVNALANFSKSASQLMKKAIQTGSEFNLKDLASKALTIAGTDGEVLAIDDVLGTSILEAAREQVTILGLIGNKNATSKHYREMVLRTLPSTAETGEQITGADWSLTDTQTYEEVSAAFAKQYAKPQISLEAMNDPAIDIFAHLQSLVIEEMARFWAQQVIGGNGSPNRLRGILGSRTDEVEGIKSQANRDLNSFPILYSGVAGSLGNADITADGNMIDVVIDLTTALPSKYLPSASFLMNRRTLAQYRKLKDTLGRPMIQFEAGGFTLLGFTVNLEDYWPDVAANSFPLLFGDLKKAFALVNYSENYLLDPYSVDGAVLVKMTVEKGDIVQNNDAVILLCAAVAA
jgi:HK97 family phage major capsid protein